MKNETANRKSFLRISIAIFVLITVLNVSVFSQEKAQNSAETYFTNTEITDQNGKKLKFYKDVLKDKVVVINAFNATSHEVSSVISKTLQKFQEAFPDNLGKELFIISITVDAENDTSGKLKEYAKTFDAKPGRLFLTGTRQNVDIILRKLGLYVENKESHSAVLIVGNEKTGLWKKANGLASAEDLTKTIKSVLNDTGDDNVIED